MIDNGLKRLLYSCTYAKVSLSRAHTFQPIGKEPILAMDIKLHTNVFFLYLAYFRLNVLLSEAYAEDEKTLEKMKKWRDWRDKLNSKYKKTRGKFNKVKGQGIPKEPKKVQEQLEITRVSHTSCR